jgi:N-carbamoyl-L-amino-acid hydrolase
MAVVNFVDEEGARFGVACAGSRILTGALSPERALALTDADGTTMADALAAAGRDPLALGSDPDLVGRIGAFVELHVEQGRALDDVHANVGVGSHIWPHGRWRIDVPGEANHAGTTALDDRRDAMLGFAAAVIAARRAAQSRGCVATVGKVRATPNGVNAIPSEVTGWLDARGESEAAVHQVVADVTEVMADFEATVQEESWTPTTMPSTTHWCGASRAGSAAYRCWDGSRPRCGNPCRRGSSRGDALRAQPDRDLALARGVRRGRRLRGRGAGTRTSSATSRGGCRATVAT